MQLGLERVADQRIGGVFQKSLSGGEKRRVSVGVEMMAQPSILLLDEPTTGQCSLSPHQSLFSCASSIA